MKNQMKTIRIKNNLSINDVGRLSGVDDSVLYLIEKGIDIKLPIASLLKICSVLNSSVEEIFFNG